MSAKRRAPRLEHGGPFKAGPTWIPVATKRMPTFGVGIGVEFLEQPAAGLFQTWRVLAIPSLTPAHTTDEILPKALAQAGGGSTVIVDEGRVRDPRDFPVRAGVFEPGDEGVVIADMDLDLVPRGSSTRTRRVLAQASLVCAHHPIATDYAALLEECRPAQRLERLAASYELLNTAEQVEAPAEAVPMRQANTNVEVARNHASRVLAGRLAPGLALAGDTMVTSIVGPFRSMER